MPSVFIALGSNIDPESNVKKAAEMLRERWPDIRFSSVYRTKARHVEEQADFLNAVAVFSGNENAQSIQKTLQEIESALKKSPPYTFGPRTIDLDILLYGDDVIHENNLEIPHPRMHERRFVLEPLLELLDPESHHPALLRPWKELWAETRAQGSVKTPVSLASS